eukprot:Protomagalhaensia_sp_Gyna_25__1319@NODE_1662_length_1650_cov_56_957790_g1360_i0_p1_GENE_NODE_1662_length_1650_cov_56_957790_g1360_i0NODE_1662_length_1650_cov_56_957790_g1360_i0_p1_ORF_typecomplete_len520_score69_26ACPS/PF01648_20/0_073PIR/PF00399_19/0_61KAR9/PF08580_10/3_4_NODE_1662_length_1650_cov_56_957790_g1360_i0511610
MGINHRRNYNSVQLAIPLLDARGNVEGWYKFDDTYLSPEVRYTAFPPTTSVKLGGRFIEIDRAVAVKIRLLEEEEDYYFWCHKKQHSQRICCGEYHKDFGDVEVGYSFSSPQTHIWFAGYAVHTEAFENLHITSYNATVRVTPEHIIPKALDGGALRQAISNREAAERLADGSPKTLPLSGLSPSRSLFEMVVEEGADFPVYTAAVPVRKHTHKGYVTELVPTAEFINDCEREIVRRDQWDVGAAVSQISDPVSSPPTFPPVRPFENSSLFWSFIYNQLLAKRLSRDELEQAYRDIALLNRLQQYDMEAIKKDKEYQRALDRLAAHFSTKKSYHKVTWPTTPAEFKECECVVCKGHRRRSRHGRPSTTSTESSVAEVPSPRQPESSRRRESSRRQDFVTPSPPSGPASPPFGLTQIAESKTPHCHHHHRHQHRHGSRRREGRPRTSPRQRPTDDSPPTEQSSESLRQRRAQEREEASRRLVANCLRGPVCSPEDIAATSSPPSVFTVPLYINAGGIRNV